MKKIRNDIANYIFILKLVKNAGIIVFIGMFINILIETYAYYVGTKIGLWVFDSVEVSNMIKCCLLVLFIYLSLFIPKLVSNWLEMYSTPITMFKVNEAMMKDMVDKVFQIRQQEVEKPIFFDKYSRAISEISVRPGDAVLLLKNIISGALQFVVVTAIVSRLSLKYTLLFLVATIINTVITILTNTQEYKKYEESTKFNRKLGYVNRLIYQQEFGPLLRNNIGYSVLLKNYYGNNIDELKDITKKYHPRLYIFRLCSDFVSAFLLGWGPWTYAIIGLYSGKLSFGEVTLVMGATNLIPTISFKLFSSIVSVRKQSLYINNLREIMDFKKIRKHGDVIPSKNNEIAFETSDLAFSYVTESQKMVLCNINIKIYKNEKVALVGPNGAGKSTLANLLSGLYSPTEGNVYVEGDDLAKINIETIHDRIIMCNQNTYMLSFSIAENILQRPPRNLEDYAIVEDALKKVGMYEKVSKLKNGLDSYFSKEFDEDGVVLSGGEMQKLAIARVYVSNANIVIMDEPTSALDSISEKEITDLLFDVLKDKTVIIISHRLAFINKVDTVYYIDNGYVVEEGSHDELMNQKGKYYELYSMQAKQYYTI